MAGCFLCEKYRDEPEKDRENLLLHRGELCYVVLNLYPYTNGHLMIVPYAHEGNLEELDYAVLCELMALTQWGVKLLKESMRADGFNIGVNLGRSAGAGVEDHFHLHVVPRWGGDTNFMTVLGETRLIPETLPETFDKLIDAVSLVGPPQASADMTREEQ
jgi:ATP adenylyltransferase